MGITSLFLFKHVFTRYSLNINLFSALPFSYKYDFKIIYIYEKHLETNFKSTLILNLITYLHHKLCSSNRKMNENNGYSIKDSFTRDCSN